LNADTKFYGTKLFLSLFLYRNRSSWIPSPEVWSGGLWDGEASPKCAWLDRRHTSRDISRPPLSTIYPLLFPYFIEIVLNIFNDFTSIITPIFFISYILNQKSF